MMVTMERKKVLKGQIFEALGSRFDSINLRFESMDHRFESVEHQIVDFKDSIVAEFEKKRKKLIDLMPRP